MTPPSLLREIRARDLARRVERLDPITAVANPRLLDDVVEYLARDVERGERDPQRDAVTLSWARWADRASTRLHRPGDPRALVISHLYEKVLTEQGLSFDATQVCRRRLDTARHLADPVAIVHAMRSLALALHRDSDCCEARLQIAETAAAAPAAGWLIEVHVRCVHAQIAAACGHTESALRILRRHRQLIGFLGERHAIETARNLAHSEAEHPHHGCAYQPAGRDGAPRFSFWHTQVHAALNPIAAPTDDTSRYDAATSRLNPADETEPHHAGVDASTCAGLPRYAWRGHHDL